MKYLGVLFVILGFVSLVYGGISYRQRHTLLKVGDVQATHTEHKRFTIPPAFGVVLLLGGVAMLFVDGGREHRR